MRLRILGSAAGGGAPQWNCRCPVCALAWKGDPRVRRRTQASLAVSGDGERWVLLDASPDLRQQILDTPCLQPRRDGRDSPIADVVITNADVDHVAGLLTLRERQEFTLHAAPAVLDLISGNPIFRVLAPEMVRMQPLPFDAATPVAGLLVEAIRVPGKVPLWMEDEDAPADAGDTTGLLLRDGDGGAFAAYVPGCARVTDALRDRVRGAALLLFDGTLWRDDEIVRAGVGQKTGRRMGHISISGPEGAVAAWEGVSVGRKLFIHLNNTNPVLVDGSAERDAVAAAGWELAEDGMELVI